MTGTIKRITGRGFGFITVGGGEPDVFFHASALPPGDFDNLQVGDELVFEVDVDNVRGDGKRRAINVRRIDADEEF